MSTSGEKSIVQASDQVGTTITTFHMSKDFPELAFGRIPSYCRYELFMERYRSASEIVRRELEITPETQILDVGCGNGYMKKFFDPGEGKWFGIEVWDERIRCCERLGYEIAAINIETTPFPFEDERFDVVFASHVIEHLPEPEKALKECARVLKPRGLMLVATPTKPPLIAGLINAFHRSKSKKLGQTQQAFSAPSLRHLVSSVLQGIPDTEWRLVDCRGLRVISCRKRFKLENLYWFYRMNTMLARWATYLVPEINLIYQKQCRDLAAKAKGAANSLCATGATMASACAMG